MGDKIIVVSDWSVEHHKYFTVSGWNNIQVYDEQFDKFFEQTNELLQKISERGLNEQANKFF